jgi:hypothetical protein
VGCPQGDTVTRRLDLRDRAIGSTWAVDDESGWNDLLLELWTEEVRDAVVRRIEDAMVGRRGWLVRVFAAPEQVRAELTETVHAVVLAAIRDETGADLDVLGSQAAWECYEQVWEELAGRWADGGRTEPVPLGAEPAVVRSLAVLPPEAAVCAGVDLDADGRTDPCGSPGGCASTPTASGPTSSWMAAAPPPRCTGRSRQILGVLERR